MALTDACVCDDIFANTSEKEFCNAASVVRSQRDESVYFPRETKASFAND